MNDVSTARDIMTIEWKDPNMRLHGKRHKNDRYYFRWHYGKQRVVQISGEYVDKPTERQKSAREAFTELRREVARQLKDEKLRSEWMRRFAADNEGYKMLHTYVYAMMKRGETVLVDTSVMRVSASEETPRQETQYVAVRGLQPIIIVYNGAVVPIFLPWKVPKRNVCGYNKKALPLQNMKDKETWKNV